MNLHGVRMWVTEGCNASCHFCMNAQSRSNNIMEFHKFERLCQYFNQNHYDKISIMGGEPTTHPEFINIMQTAQRYFGHVYLFTNAIQKKELLMFTPREQDTIIYNFNFSKLLSEDKLMLSKPGSRVLDVVINNATNPKSVVEEITRITKLSRNRINIQLVLDNMENIFSQKKFYIKIINEIYQSLSSIDGIQVKFECNAPLCFSAGEQLPPFTPNAICSPTSVLIDGQYNVRMCNIYTGVLTNMFRGDYLIPYKLLENHITLAHAKAREECLMKICKDCLYYGRQCNGKCLIAQPKVSREDIILNTSLSWF